ncbi:MAG TPA: hypothetical protein PLO78_07700 [Candidatus Omnitrophota bacterium]|nr:hypothetical protein [Candidatus Omnitrophota bacterium]
MKKRNLKKINVLVSYPMTSVMAQTWFLSTKCRHTGNGRGLLRDALEDRIE